MYKFLVRSNSTEFSSIEEFKELTKLHVYMRIFPFRYLATRLRESKATNQAPLILSSARRTDPRELHAERMRIR